MFRIMDFVNRHPKMLVAASMALLVVLGTGADCDFESDCEFFC